MVDEYGCCDKPDRHNPKLKCGHPMPCPYHTVIIDGDNIFYPEEKDEKTKQHVRDIAEALKDL